MPSAKTSVNKSQERPLGVGGLNRPGLVAQLRDQIAEIENRPAFEKYATEKYSTLEKPGLERSGFASASDYEFKPAQAGLLHEIWTDEVRNSGAVLGFALGQARALLTKQRPVVLWMQLAHEAMQTGLPYASGLDYFGFDAQALIICRLGSVNDLLWAVEEASACPAVAAIIADIVHPTKVLNFTSSRRLGLRATREKASIFMMRYGLHKEASAVDFRWRVSPVLSGDTAFDARAPGRPRWQVKLEKGAERGGQAGQKNWILNWTEHGFATEQSGRNTSKKPLAATTVLGPVSAVMGDRVSQTA